MEYFSENELAEITIPFNDFVKDSVKDAPTAHQREN